jgi:hypothetical protein
MRCTECNKRIKPVVAVDIDGTMGMYHYHFLEFAAAYLNQQVYDHYVGNQPFKDWFCNTYRCTPDDWHDIKLAYRQGGMKRTMPVYAQAAFLCQSIQDAGAELWVTTTRPYIRHDNIDPDTREWLRRHRIKYDYLIYDGHKYNKLKQLVGEDRVCAVLDDLEEEISEAHRLFGGEVPILRVNEYNTAFKSSVGLMVPAVQIATNLEMAFRLIHDRIKKWEVENANGSSRSGATRATA